MNKSNIKYKFRLSFNTINIFELRNFGKAVP